MTEEPRMHFPYAMLPSVTEGLFLFFLSSFLSSSNFLSFQKTLKQDEQCHLPALRDKEVSLLWTLLSCPANFEVAQ